MRSAPLIPASTCNRTTDTAFRGEVEAFIVPIKSICYDIITIAEVGTGSNVALNAPTVASSAGFGGPPAGAVDGNISAGCCGQLWHGINNGAQLTITLPNPTDIEKLNFFSRIGCCGDPRTDNFQVRLFDDLGTLIFQQNILGAESQSNQGTPLKDQGA